MLGHLSGCLSSVFNVVVMLAIPGQKLFTHWISPVRSRIGSRFSIAVEFYNEGNTLINLWLK